MDYQGNYFPDEQDENSSKTYRVIKGIFKWTMYGISFVLYAFLFITMFINRESDIIENNYIHEVVDTSIDTDTVELYKINPRVFMNETGSLQVFNVDYSDEYGTLEIGVKFNLKKLTDKDPEGLSYELCDDSGKVYRQEYFKHDKAGRYGYNRLCFTDVKLDLDSNDLRYDVEKDSFARTNEKYFLNVYDKDDMSLVYTFEIYNNKTVFSKTDYQN